MEGEEVNGERCAVVGGWGSRVDKVSCTRLLGNWSGDRDWDRDRDRDRDRTEMERDRMVDAHGAQKRLSQVKLGITSFVCGS
ncbi:hypothetical protein A8708_14060 [Paenibacillus oryzisoli]|uniref:Uncharacterized protein n=1 Tax=Paenibacillus oryzisoli TaxID=1850517 RepID=A0A198A3C8_9BACL|nr:hypothetical protein A8708_14060 [Paenibacillus oryzisoli]